MADGGPGDAGGPSDGPSSDPGSKSSRKRKRRAKAREPKHVLLLATLTVTALGCVVLAFWAGRALSVLRLDAKAEAEAHAAAEREARLVAEAARARLEAEAVVQASAAVAAKEHAAEKLAAARAEVVRLWGMLGASQQEMPVVDADPPAQAEGSANDIYGGGEAHICSKMLMDSCTHPRPLLKVLHEWHSFAHGWTLAGHGAGWGIPLMAAMNHIEHRRLAPRRVPLHLICHKGMGKISAEPPLGLPHDGAQGLGRMCGSRLMDGQMEHVCPSVPGILVRTTQNPCGSAFRMIDGSHRLCAFKSYLLRWHTDKSAPNAAAELPARLPPCAPRFFVIEEEDAVNMAAPMLSIERDEDEKEFSATGPNGDGSGWLNRETFANVLEEYMKNWLPKEGGNANG